MSDRKTSPLLGLLSLHHTISAENKGRKNTLRGPWVWCLPLLPGYSGRHAIETRACTASRQALKVHRYFLTTWQETMRD